MSIVSHLVSVFTPVDFVSYEASNIKANLKPSFERMLMFIRYSTDASSLYVLYFTVCE
jgi:hypothetical protein